MTKFWILAQFIFILNVPFGYWRANVKGRTFQWLLSIHLPVLLIAGLRIYEGVTLDLTNFLVLVGVFSLGQYAGSLIHQWRLSRESAPLTSCLIWDLLKERLPWDIS